MKFIINETIIYNEIDGTLMISDNEESTIQLLKPTCRLLSILVRNNNILITRERLLNEVWGEYGLKTSNNNLNNYTSMLRKSFISLGEDNLVVTQPRLGFRFTAHKVEPYEQNTTPLSLQGKRGKKNRWYLGGFARREKPATGPGFFTPWLKLGAIAAISLLPLLGFMLYQNNAAEKISLLGQYKHCRIYSVKGYNNLPFLINLTRKSTYDCESGGDIYYYSQVRDSDMSPSEPSKALLTYCPQDKTKACRNSYFYP